MTVYWKQVVITVALLCATVAICWNKSQFSEASLVIILGSLMAAAKLGLSPIEGNPKTTFSKMPPPMPPEDKP